MITVPAHCVVDIVLPAGHQREIYVPYGWETVDRIEIERGMFWFRLGLARHGYQPDQPVEVRPTERYCRVDTLGGLDPLWGWQWREVLEWRSLAGLAQDRERLGLIDNEGGTTWVVKRDSVWVRPVLTWPNRTGA
jgi:hypothetical protein